jgi:acetyl-CoA carboxylase biotin carboxyl carrier protein
MADPSPSGDVFDLTKVRELVALMKEHDLSEVDLKQAEQQIRLKRGGSAPVYAAPAPSYAPPPAAGPSAPAANTTGPAADGPNIKVIKSPMVGTFYSRPSPDAKNFISVGDHVGPESVVCIIEAMKVFNEIQSEVSGQIVAVLCQNEEPVEFGKPLFKVDTGK